MTHSSQKLIVVIGPTASGKSEFAVALAHQLDGEIISADSRQVYRGLDIGTGKVEGAWISHPDLSLRGGGPATTKQSTEPHTATSRLPRRLQSQPSRNDGKTFVYKDIPHYCIDYVDPNYRYSVADFKRDAEMAIADIVARGKTPILCGGTGQFVDAIVFNQQIPPAEPDPAFRKTLEGKSTTKLFALLQAQDPQRAASIDPHNPRRLIRALEIIHTTGNPVPKRPTAPFSPFGGDVPPRDREDRPIEIHYLNPPRAELFQKIEARLKQRVEQGMVNEVARLHETGLSWERMDELGLEYRYIAQYLQAQSLRGASALTSDAAISQPNIAKDFPNSPFYASLLTQIKHYAKRQQTWFKKYIPLSTIK